MGYGGGRVKPVLVTGATGFIGSHVAGELLRRGCRVRALVREKSDPGQLPALGAELFRGDLLDAAVVERAVAGCDAVLHLAADFRLWAPDEQVIYRTNVDGTRQVLAAALAAGVSRAVYTSTAAILTPFAPDPPSTPSPDQDPLQGGEPAQAQAAAADGEPHLADLADLSGPYDRSKWQAEQEARRLARDGLPLIIVYPTVPVGPGDRRPTPTGKLIVDCVRGRLPFYVRLPLNVAAVEDIAVGHVLALEQGRTGEGYILGGRNLTLRDLLVMVDQIADRQRFRIQVPTRLALLAALFDEGIFSRLTGRPPQVSFASVRMATRCLWFDSRKAVRELGLPQTSIEAALKRAVEWFRREGCC
jgi:dihydroflavonol-4-reductase